MGHCGWASHRRQSGAMERKPERAFARSREGGEKEQSTRLPHAMASKHEYQWKTEREFKEAQGSFLNELSQGDTDSLLVLVQAMEDGRTIPGLPNDDGGYGFDASTNPLPDCPECHGEGIANVVVADTREALAHPLYEGVKQTQHGIEIKIADRAKALEQVARHLQIFKDEVEVSASEELLEAARAISAASPALTPDYVRQNAHRLNALEDNERDRHASGATDKPMI